MSSSPVTSPTQSPAPSPVTSLSNVCTGLSPLPVLTQFPRPGGPAQGKGSVRWAAVSCQIHPLHPIPTTARSVALASRGRTPSVPFSVCPSASVRSPSAAPRGRALVCLASRARRGPDPLPVSQKCSTPHSLGIFMEASSHRHDQFQPPVLL